ncbi:DUF6455 family protein [Bosea sp. LjRoot9]|uniref:DUF6455 family protein n=1 Tax=Bosea sp. LjRoot9 TaxID=3342341 RepID=UPI003F4FA22E
MPAVDGKAGTRPESTSDRSASWLPQPEPSEELACDETGIVPGKAVPTWALNSKDTKMRGWLRDRVERQARLMSTMLERIGIDPGLAALRGRTFAAAGRRCLWCAASQQCERWLEETGSAARGPSFCPNTQIFEEVRSVRSTATNSGAGTVSG